MVSIDQANAAFWHELCGTNLAKTIGVTDDSPASLRRFDDWYFRMYPYLDKHIRFSEWRGRHVLEVGLGYGSVGQRLIDCGALYSGLDISLGPVAMMNHRAGAEVATIGSIHAAPFANESFDGVVAIGCFHHTGSIQKAIDESWRILKHGGVLVFMVYNADSYRQRWGNKGKETYDGNGVPHTEFVSRAELRQICIAFQGFSCRLENINQERPFSRLPRGVLLNTPIPFFCGLDIYARAIK